MKAFLNAWKEACRSGGTVSIVAGTYLLNTIQFAGPCNGQVSFMVNAVIQAPPGQSNAHYWISFDDINGLTIQGNGTFDGQGPSAWPFNDCRHAASCSPLSPVSSVSTKYYECQMYYRVTVADFYFLPCIKNFRYVSGRP